MPFCHLQLPAVKFDPGQNRLLLGKTMRIHTTSGTGGKKKDSTQTGLQLGEQFEDSKKHLST